MSRYLFVALLLLAAIFLYIVDPTSAAPFIPKCVFHELTGWSCPGCGLQRSVHALLHGHLREAAAYNYYNLLALPYLLLVAFSEMALKGERRERWRRKVEHPVVVGTFLVVMIAWTVGRNVYGL